MELSINTATKTKAKQNLFDLDAKGFDALAQEICVLLSTRKGSVPLDRDFGLDWSFIDSPLPSAMPLYVAEVARQIEKYIPRVQFIRVDFNENANMMDLMNGILKPIVVIKIRREYEHEFK